MRRIRAGFKSKSSENDLTRLAAQRESMETAGVQTWSNAAGRKDRATRFCNSLVVFCVILVRMDSESSPGSALRPLTLNSPGAAAIWREIAEMKAELESVGKVATGYKCVEADLGCLTDEVTRDTLVRSCLFVDDLRKPHFFVEVSPILSVAVWMDCSGSTCAGLNADLMRYRSRLDDSLKFQAKSFILMKSLSLCRRRSRSNLSI